ncbi:MAG: DUF2911 domain-containing protein [Chitinophagaceae bacterium]|nr:MAG: DUF2911 domain-containing protein [Chitinophagaceae bacterium]
MKTLLALVAAATISLSVNAQAELPAVDKSPMDISYYPSNYPVLRVQDKASEPCVARVVYSRPKKEGRPIFGELVEFGKLWRLGANEATELEFFKPVTISGKKIPKGRYTLYAIVNEKTWTIILNKETDIWGSFKYSQSKDVLRTDVPVQVLDKAVEYLAMTFEKSNGIPQLVIAWDNIKVALPFNP